ncbi:MAG: hypothetical protein KC503_30900 [Myxococcales bacterium]|nr:hypothetical protein [Myxococcales bacterium]
MKTRSAALLLALVLCSPTAAAARDLTGARSMALGGALRAQPAGVAGPLLNPAGLSMARMYSISAIYQYRGSDQASQMNAAVIDSVTAKLAAGLFYSFTHASPERTLALPNGAYKLEETLNTHEVGLSLAYPLGNIAMIGVTGRYVNKQGTLPDDAPTGLSTADVSRFTMDVGGLVRLGQLFSVAVVGYNLIAVGDRDFPRSLGLGAAFTPAPVLSLMFDSVIDFSSDPEKAKASFHGGAEVFLAKMYAIRGGAMHDMLRRASYVTGGLGLVSRRIGVEFGLRQMVDGGSETLVSFQLQLFLQ